MSAIDKIKVKKYYILNLEDKAYTDSLGNIILFSTAKEAEEYIKDNKISGSVKNNS